MASSPPPQLPTLQHHLTSGSDDAFFQTGGHGPVSPVSSTHSRADYSHAEDAHEDGDVPLQPHSINHYAQVADHEEHVPLQHLSSHHYGEVADEEHVPLQNLSTRTLEELPVKGVPAPLDPLSIDNHQSPTETLRDTLRKDASPKESIANAYETWNTDSDLLLNKEQRKLTYNYHDSRKWLFRTGFARLLVTFIFCALICLTLRAYEGFDKPVILSNRANRMFNAIMLGLSLGLGLNLASSLKKYAVTLRWSLLTRRFITLETFDLILGVETLTKVMKLMLLSMPGIRSLPLLRSIPWLKKTTRDGPRYTWIFCMLWLLVNIGAQILVAALSLFWPVNPSSAMPLFTHGNVSISDLQNWKGVAGYNLPNNQSQLLAAKSYGMQAEDFPEFPIDEDKPTTLATNRNSIFQGEGFWRYRFLNRNPDHPFVNVLSSGRTIQATASCEQLPMKGHTLYEDDDGMHFANVSLDGTHWQLWSVPEKIDGGLSYTASHEDYCGPRCTNFTVYQDPDDELIFNPAFFLCNSTLEPVSGSSDFTHLTSEDFAHINGDDEFARIGAGAIAWAGYTQNGHDYVQWTSYLGGVNGSRWSPPHAVTSQEVEGFLTRFAIGAVAAFDDHGPAYIVQNQDNRPVQGQQLDVDWGWVFGILCGILVIQLAALVLLLAFANKSIIRDESFFSIAMLLAPVVAQVGKGGMGLSGTEIMRHPKMRNERIRYGYSEDSEGTRRVGVLFERGQRRGKRAWDSGRYT